MLKQILKIFGKSAGKATKSVGKSMEFVDDILEKEYIVNAVEGAKEATGKIIEGAGKAYQKTKDSIEDNVDMEMVKNKVNETVTKGKQAGEQFKEKLSEQSDTMKNIMDEGEKMMGKFFGEEE